MKVAALHLERIARGKKTRRWFKWYVERLAILRAAKLLDTKSDPRFDHLTQLCVRSDHGCRRESCSLSLSPAERTSTP